MRRTGLAAWNAGSAGNYYCSDYNGTEPDGGGIGGNSIDHFQLMQPCTATPQKGDLHHNYDQITPADVAIAAESACNTRCDKECVN